MTRKMVASKLILRATKRARSCRITDRRSAAGRAQDRVQIIRTVPPGRSVPVRGYPHIAHRHASGISAALVTSIMFHSVAPQNGQAGGFPERGSYKSVADLLKSLAS